MVACTFDNCKVYHKEKHKQISRNQKSSEVEKRLRTKIPDTHNVRIMSNRWECNACLEKRKTKKDVNRNLGMMLPGTLVRKSTRIKKYCSGIYLYTKGVCTGSRFMVKECADPPQLLYFSHRAHKQKNERA